MFAKLNSVYIILIFSLFYNSTVLNASVYDDSVLNVFSKILPRLILMSSQKDRVENDLEICVLHDKVDATTALSLIEKVNNNYPNGLKHYKINLINSNYSQIHACQNSQLAFMLNADRRDIEKAIKFSSKHAILTVAYDEILLEDGVSVSLFLGRKVTPYVNMESLRANGIELDNLLLRISKIYDGGKD